MTSKDIFFPTTSLTNELGPQGRVTVLAPITIISTPTEATVRLNGNVMGTTPLSLANLRQHNNVITLEKSGFSKITIALAPPDSATTIAFDLQKQTYQTSSIPEKSFQETLDYLNNNDANIPFELTGKIVVPEGFRFPDNADINQPLNLEPIPLALLRDSTTQQMPLDQRSTLFNRLNTNYRYDPNTQTMFTEAFRFAVSIINFETFDPQTLNIRSGSELLWYNQSTEDCELRTDPKSPMRINQKVAVQKSTVLSLINPGIYIFFCQGNPGPTQTITVY